MKCYEISGFRSDEDQSHCTALQARRQRLVWYIYI